MEEKQLILLIEDHPDIRENLSEFFIMENYNVLSAANGSIGLKLIHQHRPHLILCDIRMPETDGFQVLKQVRENPELSTIPFIFITSHSEKKDKAEALSLGADDMIIKPFDPEQVLSRISELIAVGQRR